MATEAKSPSREEFGAFRQRHVKYKPVNQTASLKSLVADNEEWDDSNQEAHHFLPSTLFLKKLEYAVRSGLAATVPSLALTLGPAGARAVAWVPGGFSVFGVVVALAASGPSLGHTLDTCANLVASGPHSLPWALGVVRLVVVVQAWGWGAQWQLAVGLAGLFVATFAICHQEGLPALTRKFALEITAVGILGSGRVLPPAAGSSSDDLPAWWAAAAGF
uniref:Uncharacterized protein n=1 Tax=Heterosigma akashiwo TaxID=2829 RepID=A0A7S3YHX6_HETAK